MEIKERKKQIFVFLDTNLLWNETFDFNIFATTFLNQIITLRGFFKKEIKNTQIKIIFPQTVVRERYKQKFDVVSRDIEHTLRTLEILKKNKKFNNEKTIEILKDIKNNLHDTIESDGKKFLLKHDIIITPECPQEYFEKIIEKAYNKETPFKNKKSDGFKDAILWYSIIDYIKNENLGNEDSIFFFTQNKFDFDSESNLKEFKNLTKKDLRIIDFKLKPMQIFESENREFLKYTLKEAQTVKITDIEIKYSEFEDNLIIEKILANPFPSNLVSLISRSNIERQTCKKIVKERIIQLLKNFNFNIDSEKIRLNFVQLPFIENVVVCLTYHTSAQYYDIDHIEIEFENGDECEVEPKNENTMIWSESITYYDDEDFTIFQIDPKIHEGVINIINKLIDRELAPDNVRYTILD